MRGEGLVTTFLTTQEQGHGCEGTANALECVFSSRMLWVINDVFDPCVYSSDSK